MTTLTEKFRAGSFLLSEASGQRSRKNAVLNSGQNLQAGTVLGRILGGLAAAAALATNTANSGALTLDATAPVQPGAIRGVYKVRCIAAAANSGTFRVFDPAGNVLGDVVVAATFSNHIKFAIADGAGDFVVGDGFDVTVTAVNGDYTQLAPAATNGSQYAAAILWDTTDASTADTACAIVDTDAEVIGAGLTWPTITDTQKAAAIGDLARQGIVVR